MNNYKLKPYLGGAILGCSDSQCKQWREEVKKIFPKAIDPMRRDYRGKESQNFEKIVELDKKDIEDSDCLLVNYQGPSAGTCMEILYAWERGLPVYIVTSKNVLISPWVKYHSSRFYYSFEDAFVYLRKFEQAIALVEESIKMLDEVRGK